MHGTTIGDLNKKDFSSQYGDIRSLQDMTKVNYNANQNLFYEQGHNAAHCMHQAQQMPYFTMENVPTPAQGYLSQKDRQKMAQESTDIEELAKDINDNFPPESEETFGSGSNGEEHYTDNSLHLLSGIPVILREPIIILLLFIVLSQPAIKDTLGKYITQINPGPDCTVSFVGILIYGVILAALFALTKKFIL